MAVLEQRLTPPNLLGDFELMVQQMRENLNTLEARVANRTRDLQIAAEVSRQIATILDLDQLLPEVVELTKTNFGLYHAHIYLLDDAGANLVLAAGAGDAGRMMRMGGHSIPLNREQSLVARAARTRLGVISNDITKEPNFLPNPLLPDTHSEMALPMVLGNNLIGVLDLQSDTVERFDENDVQVQTSLAAQIALAVQNARAYVAQQAAREEVEILYAASRNIPLASSHSAQLEAVSGYARQQGATSATLFYIALDANNTPEWANTVASWETIPGQSTAVGSQFYLPEFPFTQLWLANPDKSLLVPDMQNSPLVDAESRKIYQQFGIRGNAILPLTVQGQWVGLILFNWADAHEFNPRDERIFTTLAQQVAPAVEAIRLLEATNKQRERAELLAAVNASLSNASTPEEILQAVSPTLSYYGVFSATLSYLELDSQGAPFASIAMAAYQDSVVTSPDPTANQRFLLSEFPVAKMWVQEPEKTLTIEDLMTDPRAEGELRTMLGGSGMRSLSLIPLYADGQWQGLITILWLEVHKFASHELDLYNAIAQTVASVIATQRATLATQKSERQYRQILDAIEDLVLVKGPESRILWANTAFRNYYGMTNEELDGMIGASFEQPDITQQYVIDDQKVFESGHLLVVNDEPITRHDGYVGSFSTVKSPIFDESGQVIMSVGVSRDITETKNIEQEIQRRAVELQIVADVGAAVTSILDIDELLETVAELTKESFDLYHAHVYLLDEAGENLVLAAGAGDAGRLMRMGGHSIPLNREQSLVARAARSRQGVISNNVIAEPNFLPNPLLPDTRAEMALPMVVGDTLIGVLDVQSEIQDRFSNEDVQVQTTLASQIAVAVQNASAFTRIEAQAEREHDTAERLREVDRLKSQFLANMSHELRTPLNSIIGYSEVLLDGDDGELESEALEDIQIIHSSGKYLLSIINDILDRAKIESGQMSMDIQPVDLHEVLFDVVNAAQVLVKDNGVTLDLVAEGDSPTVAADAVRLRQIVMNLVSNAAKFTEKGSITVTYGQRDADYAFISVKDSGIGIDAEDLSLIFDQFRQVDGSSTRRAGGTGLGLTITRYLVEMHGGQIQVESEIGAGSTFYVTLPVHVSELA